MKSLSKINGVGIGLRSPHFEEIIDKRPDIPWFEILADNYLSDGGIMPSQLEVICADYPIAFHCVGMNLGSTAPLDFDYLKKIKLLINRYNPCWISDHASWCGVEKRQHHDLLPLPYTQEAILVVTENIMRVQDFFGENILLENASSYIQFKNPEMHEWEFLSEISNRSGCNLLLDVNNVHVNSHNHRFSEMDFLKGLPKERIKQLHLAGHLADEFVLIDTHGAAIPEKVWKVFEEAIHLFGPIPTTIERDNDIPELKELMWEMNIASNRMNKCS